MPTVSELLEQKAALESQIAEARRAERADAIAKVRALMSEHGLSTADLTARTGAGKRSGSKVAPKYRDAATGDTWSGRGLQPKWLKAALVGGRRLEDFAL